MYFIIALKNEMKLTDMVHLVMEESYLNTLLFANLLINTLIISMYDIEFNENSWKQLLYVMVLLFKICIFK